MPSLPSPPLHSPCSAPSLASWKRRRKFATEKLSSSVLSGGIESRFGRNAPNNRSAPRLFSVRKVGRKPQPKAAPKPSPSPRLEAPGSPGSSLFQRPKRGPKRRRFSFFCGGGEGPSSKSRTPSIRYFVLVVGVFVVFCAFIFSFPEENMRTSRPAVKSVKPTRAHKNIFLSTWTTRFQLMNWSPRNAFPSIGCPQQGNRSHVFGLD